MKTLHPNSSSFVTFGFCVFVSCFSSYASGQSVTSSALSFGSDDVSASTSTTSNPGEVVQQSASADGYTSFPQTYFGTANGTSSAATSYGLNRIRATGQLIGIIGPGPSGSAYVDSVASSLWQDTWTIVGGNVGDVVTLSLVGRTTYALALGGGALPFAPALDLFARFVAGGPFDSDQADFANQSFVANAGAGYFDWSLSLTALSGSLVPVTMYLSASMSSGSAGLDLGITNKTFAFDAMNTSVLSRIGLTDGYSISAASGEVVPYDGDFAYLAVLAAVPEPETWALMIAGLVVLAGLARRRSGGSALLRLRSTSFMTAFGDR